jgi:flagellar biosynthesis/type III secretory pathway ATPase
VIERLQTAMLKAHLAVNNLVALQKTYPSVDITNALSAAQSALVAVQQILASGAQ